MMALWYLALILAPFLGISAEMPLVMDLSNDQARQQAVERLRQRQMADKVEAEAMARKQGWPIRGVANGRIFELMKLENGHPAYYITDNINAAISTAANLVRNTPPYSVNGNGWTVGVWDGGAARTTHQEFGGRITIKDGASAADHATHVSGTIIATGVVASAQGMAPSAKVDSYEWTSDISEMTSRAATAPNQTDRLYFSNHSYGFLTGWDIDGAGAYRYYGIWPEREDRDFGQYGSDTVAWDNLCYNAPYFLPFKSAGNDRNDTAPPAGTNFYYLSGGSWTNKAYNPATDPYSDGYDNGGFDTMETQASAKNILTVGAVNDAVSGGIRSLAAATMSSFSCWGPTDDGRVKPDIVANGVSLNSPVATSDSAYAIYGGTSMSTPNAAGSAVLLAHYYASLFPGQTMRASTIKALILHTADDLGNPGPDYKFGWGLMNVKTAADHLKSHQAAPAANHVVEHQLNSTQSSNSYYFSTGGNGPLRATLCWTDPAGTAKSGLDNSAPALVNDLDLRLTGLGGTNFLPFRLDRLNPANSATTGDNSVDNVEQIFIASVPAGAYTLTVSHKGSLQNAMQNYSLMISGQLDIECVVSTTNLYVPEGSSTSFAVRLSTQPLSNVVVSITRTNGDADLSVSTGASLTFTPENYATNQFATIVAAQDVDTSNGQAVFLLSASGVAGHVLTAIELEDDGAPVIVQQPSGRDLIAGQSPNFAVVAAGASPLQYQWYLNDWFLTGQTNATLNLPVVSSGQAGNYSVSVSNALGVIRSTTATLTVQNVTNSISPGIISIPDSGKATPYPSTLTLAGLAGTISKVTVTLSNLKHSWPDDLDVLLVGPQGQKVILMSDAGSQYDLEGVWLTFDDAASGTLPDALQITSGTYRPSDYETTDTLPTPAPGRPYATNLSIFNGTNPNGDWKLFLADDAGGDMGAISNGWSLNLTLMSGPVIWTDPSNQSVFVGNSAVLGVAAGGQAPLSYQWRKNGTNLTDHGNLSGATNSVLTITNAQLDNMGAYSVVVNNNFGSVTSSIANLIVSPLNIPPQISDIVNQVTIEDVAVGGVPFTVGDSETAVSNLVVWAESSNTVLVAVSNVVFGGAESNRTVTVTPSANQNGTSLITIYVADGDGGTNTDSFVLTVTPVNDAPVAGDLSVTNSEDVATNLALVVNDVDNTNWTFSILTGPTNGVLEGFDTNSGMVTYRPMTNFYGVDHFEFTAGDGAAMATGKVDLVISPVNDLPRITDIAEQVILEDTTTGTLNFTIGDEETVASNLVVWAESSNTVLVAVSNVVFGGGESNRTVTVTPMADQYGTSLITVYVADGDGGTNTDSFVLTVTPVNDAPVAGELSVTMLEDGTTNLVMGVNDVDNTNWVFAVLTGPTNGVLEGFDTNSGVVTYRPVTNYYGADHFEFTASDGAAMATGRVDLAISPVNDAPFALSGFLTNGEDLAMPITLEGWDVDGLVTNFTVLSPPASGVLSGTAPSLSYTPAAHFTGEVALTFVVDDGSLTSAVGTVTLAITNVNDLPGITDVADQVIPEDTTTGALKFTIGDVETWASNLVVWAESSNTALVAVSNVVFGGAESNRTVTVIPSADQNGTSLITIRVVDGDGGTNTDSFVLTVTPANDAPVITPIPDQTVVEGQTLLVTNSTSDVDLPPDQLAYALLDQPTGMTIDPDTGLISWSPLLGHGASTNVVGVTVTDNGVPVLMATQSFQVVVLETAIPSSFTLVTATNGTIFFSLEGRPNADYWLLTTSNLLSWATNRLLTLPGDGRTNISDLMTNLPTQIYRLEKKL